MKPKYSISELFLRPRDQPTGDTIIDAVLTLLHANPGLWGKDLAEKLDIPRRDLSGAIRILTGMGINTFVTEWHKLKAIELLKNPRLDFATIAHRCGYRQPKHLARALDQELGFTPFEYRNGYRRGVQRPLRARE